MIDLDNTLVDRVAAFRNWTSDFLGRHRLPTGTAPTIEALDEDGMRRRSEFFRLVSSACDSVSPSQVEDDYLANYPTLFRLDDKTSAALEEVQRRRHTVGVITNGPPFQEDVIRSSGLDQLVKGWVISELVGFRKPDVRIAHALAAEVNTPLSDGIVVGDGLADMELAHNLALPGAWIARKRVWPSAIAFAPSAITATAAEALHWAADYFDDHCCSRHSPTP